MSACTAQPVYTPESTPSPQVTQTPQPATEPAPSETPVPVPTEPVITATPVITELPVPRYEITASLDDANHTVAATERIVYFNRSGDPMTEIPLIVEPMIYEGGFQPGEVAVEGPALKDTTWDGTILRLALAEPLQPGQSIAIDTSYKLVLPARVEDPNRRPMVYGWSDRQVNLVDWYPYVPPYVTGQGWLYNKIGPYGEHQVYETSDFNIQFQLVNAREGLIVAASAPGQESDSWYRYELQAARSFAISVSPDYVVKSSQVGDITVNTYTFSAHAVAGEQVLQTTTESLALFSELFGPYPHAELAVVEADFLDGMEYSGLFFLSNGFYNLSTGAQTDYAVAISAHETAHQWWFERVGNDQAQEPWLDEALCTYSEQLYYERLHPEALRWWWTYRVGYYEPHGAVDDTIYNPRYEINAYRAYVDAVYLNGAVFMQELRELIGDEAFFSFLADYAAQNTHKIATAKDFFNLLSQHTDVDLSDMLKKYFIMR